MQVQTSQVKKYEHLYQMYPNLPQYANDPEQSQIIRSYDLMLKRFEGIYNRQPKYFVRSPATLTIFGSDNPYLQNATVSISSQQNIVVCIAQNGHQQVRFNHYQSAVYGQKIFQTQSVQWKYDEKNDQYTNIVLASLKAYSVIFSMHTLQGVDVLIFDDFIHNDHLHWRQAMCLAIATALNSVLQDKNNKLWTRDVWRKYLGKVSNLLHQVKIIDYPFCSHFGYATVISSEQMGKNKYIEFPKGISMILAHSMTPMPKKMIKGKRQNLRACEMQIAIQIIKNQIGANQLQKYLGCTTSQLLETVNEYVPKEDLTAQKIQQITQKSLIEILKQIPFANNVIDENVIYRPYKRIKYFVEQQLVIEQLNPSNLLQRLKKSQQNALQLLENRSEQLGEMIEIVKDLAKAWKIVGNGWGGYLLILCEKQKTEEVVDSLVRQFYMSPNNKVLLSDDVDQYIKIMDSPANGLAILDPASQIWY